MLRHGHCVTSAGHCTSICASMDHCMSGFCYLLLKLVKLCFFFACSGRERWTILIWCGVYVYAYNHVSFQNLWYADISVQHVCLSFYTGIPEPVPQKVLPVSQADYTVITVNTVQNQLGTHPLWTDKGRMHKNWAVIRLRISLMLTQSEAVPGHCPWIRKYWFYWQVIKPSKLKVTWLHSQPSEPTLAETVTESDSWPIMSPEPHGVQSWPRVRFASETCMCPGLRGITETMHAEYRSVTLRHHAEKTTSELKV